MAPKDGERQRALAMAVQAAATRRGLTLAELIARSEADPALKIGKTKWNQIWHGTAPVPKATTLGKVAQVIGIDVDELLEPAGKPLAVNDGVRAEVVGLRGDVRRLTTVIERLLHEQGLLPPDPPGE